MHWSKATNNRDLGFIKKAKADVQELMKSSFGIKVDQVALLQLVMSVGNCLMSLVPEHW